MSARPEWMSEAEYQSARRGFSFLILIISGFWLMLSAAVIASSAAWFVGRMFRPEVHPCIDVATLATRQDSEPQTYACEIGQELSIEVFSETEILVSCSCAQQGGSDVE